MQGLSEDKELVGKCINCGLIREDQIEYLFPLPSRCEECGIELVRTIVAKTEAVEQFIEEHEG